MKKLGIVFSVLLLLASACKTKKKAIKEEILEKAVITDVNEGNYNTYESADTEVFEAVEESPSYPGGDSARQAFIVKNLVYPDSSIKYQRQGKVYVKFVVEPDSSVSKVHSVKSFDKESAAEAVRVTKMMRWIPGKQRGKAVRVYVVMPFVFRLY